MYICVCIYIHTCVCVCVCISMCYGSMYSEIINLKLKFGNAEKRTLLYF